MIGSIARRTLLAAALVSAALPALPQSARPGMGPIPYTGGVAFRVWAPNANAVTVAGQFNNWNANTNPLVSEGNGNWSADIAGAQVGQQYKYVIKRTGQADLWKKDPRSTQAQNSSSNANSIVANLTYNWQAPGFQIADWNELVIYEMHVGAYNDAVGGTPGNFASVLQRIDHVQQLGVNAIQLMPIHEFAGDYSWGYNPSLPYTVESIYGSPAAFMQFVDECHKRGIAVMIDVVHNHYGPSDVEFWQFDGAPVGSPPWNGGIYFYNDDRAATQWGDTRPNYGRPEVRDFIRDSATHFLEHYRIDGIRFDSTGNIWAKSNGSGYIADGWSMLQAINNDIDGTWPERLIVCEDFHAGDGATNGTGSGGLGFDSQWDGGFVHPVRAAIIDGSDANRDMNAVKGALEHRYSGSAFRRIIYTESHDEVGNGKQRVPSEIWSAQPGSWFSRKRSTLGGTLAMSAPGIPMMLMGQEILMDGYWDVNTPDTWLMDWTHKTTYAGIYELYKDLIRLRRNLDGSTKGLTGQNINVFHVNNTAKMLAYRRWENGGVGDDVVVVANFANTQWPAYDIGFPAAGTWHVLFNSDSTDYSADYGNYGSLLVNATAQGYDGMPARGTISIEKYSTLILSQKQIQQQPAADLWTVR